MSKFYFKRGGDADAGDALEGFEALDGAVGDGDEAAHANRRLDDALLALYLRDGTNGVDKAARAIYLRSTCIGTIADGENWDYFGDRLIADIFGARDIVDELIDIFAIAVYSKQDQSRFEHFIELSTNGRSLAEQCSDKH